MVLQRHVNVRGLIVTGVVLYSYHYYISNLCDSDVRWVFVICLAISTLDYYGYAKGTSCDNVSFPHSRD